LKNGGRDFCRKRTVGKKSRGGRLTLPETLLTVGREGSLAATRKEKARKDAQKAQRKEEGGELGPQGG